MLNFALSSGVGVGAQPESRTRNKPTGSMYWSGIDMSRDCRIRKFPRGLSTLNGLRCGYWKIGSGPGLYVCTMALWSPFRLAFNSFRGLLLTGFER